LAFSARPPRNLPGQRADRLLLGLKQREDIGRDFLLLRHQNSQNIPATPTNFAVKVFTLIYYYLLTFCRALSRFKVKESNNPSKG
jgi:hypothetical protein